MLKAIDVSVVQRNIDWKHVKESGIDAAIIKASQGRSEYNDDLRNFEDGRFVENVNGAYENGLHCGVYHYLTAQNVEEAKAEAEYFLSVIAKKRAYITLWAVVDVESRFLPQNKTMLTRIVLAFCDRVKAGGYSPAIYANPDFLKNRLGDISSYPLWLAHWHSNSAQWDSPQDTYAKQKKKAYPSAVIWQWGKYVDELICGTECDGDWILTDLTARNAATCATVRFVVGERVKAKSGACYTNGKTVPLWVRLLPLYVRAVRGENITISILKSGDITGVVNQQYLER